MTLHGTPLDMPMLLFQYGEDNLFAFSLNSEVTIQNKEC